MAISKVYHTVVEYFAAVTSPNRRLSFRLTTPARVRMAELIDRDERGGLTSEEALELDLYLDLERTFAAVRARARQQLSTTRLETA